MWGFIDKLVIGGERSKAHKETEVTGLRARGRTKSQLTDVQLRTGATFAGQIIIFALDMKNWR